MVIKGAVNTRTFPVLDLCSVPIYINLIVRLHNYGKGYRYSNNQEVQTKAITILLKSLQTVHYFHKLPQTWHSGYQWKIKFPWWLRQQRGWCITSNSMKGIHEKNSALFAFHSNISISNFPKYHEKKSDEHWWHIVCSDETKIDMFGSDWYIWLWCGRDYHSECIVVTMKRRGVVVAWVQKVFAGWHL